VAGKMFLKELKAVAHIKNNPKGLQIILTIPWDKLNRESIRRRVEDAIKKKNRKKR